MKKNILHILFVIFFTSTAFALTLGDNSLTPSVPLCSDRLAVGRVGDTIAKRVTVCGLDIHGSDISSASTINLTDSTGQLVDVTGTTTINAITLAEGQERVVRFTGALTLTHSSNLVLPGAANITTAAGDFAVFRGYGSSVVRMVDFQRAAGAPVSGASKLSAFASTTSAELAGVISNETGSGLLVFDTSPTLTTPALGAATATSINKVAITAPATSATLTIANGKTATINNTLTFTGTDSSSVAFGAGGTVAYAGSKLSDFASTTSSELASVISDETGSGALVFGTSPTLTTAALGSSTATTQSAGDNSTKVATTAYVDTLGGTKQPLDSELTAIAGLTSAADKLPYFTGSGTAAIADFTATARSLLDDASTTVMRNTLGLGTSDTPQFSALNIGTADSMVVNGAAITANIQLNSDSLGVQEIHTHSNTAGSGGVIYMARSRGTEASPLVVQNGDTLGIYSAVGYDGTDYAIGGTLSFIVDGTPGNNDLPTKFVIGLTADGANTPTTALTIASTGAATFASTVSASDFVGAVMDTDIGSTVQAYDAELAAVAGLTSAANKLPYFTGSGTAALADFTAAGRALVDDADATAQRATLGLGTIATQASSSVSITGGSISGISQGTGSATTYMPGALSFDVNQVGNVGSGEDDLITYPMPANTLVTTGRHLDLWLNGTYANNGNAKTTKVYFGSTVVATISATTSIAGSWRCHVVITRTGSNAQSWVTEVTRTATGGATAIANTSGTATETETAGITIKATGTATSDNDVVQTLSDIKIW